MKFYQVAEMTTPAKVIPSPSVDTLALPMDEMPMIPRRIPVFRDDALDTLRGQIEFASSSRLLVNLIADSCLLSFSWLSPSGLRAYLAD